MPSGGPGDDEDTTAASGAALGNVRRSAPPAKPADLQVALASPDDKDFGIKIFENIGLSDFTPAPVTRVGDLLKLHSYFLSPLVPLYVRPLKLPMSSEGHILSDPGLLATFFKGLLIWSAFPLSASSGVFSFILSILW